MPLLVNTVWSNVMAEPAGTPLGAKVTWLEPSALIIFTVTVQVYEPELCTGTVIRIGSAVMDTENCANEELAAPNSSVKHPSMAMRPVMKECGIARKIE